MTKKEIFKQATKLLVEVYQPEAVYLFGSYAWGNPGEESDMDFAVVIAHSNVEAFKRPLSGHLALSELEVPKDIIVYTQEEFNRGQSDPLALAFKIKKKGICLYAKA